MRRKIKNSLLLIIGAFLIAISINIFMLPNKINTGGASGIAMIIYYLYNIPVSFSILAINIPLFIIALKKLGKKFCIKAILGTILLSIFVQLTTNFANVIVVQKDMFIGSIFGGLVMGAGLSLVFKAEGSTGGTDLLAQIIYKLRPISSISGILLIIDTIVIISNALIFKSTTTAFYSVVALFLSKKTTDIIFEGVNYNKVINIITKQGNDIARKIIDETDRGVTVSNCVGIYTNEKYTHIISVVATPEVAKVKRIVKDIDSTSFVYISNTNEVLGLGFKDI